MKNIFRLLCAALLTLAATSCLQHKALGFLGIYPMNLDIIYNWTQVTGTPENPGLPGTITSLSVNTDPPGVAPTCSLNVYVFPHSGDPEYFEKNVFFVNPEDWEHTLFPITKDPEHFRGVYDILAMDRNLFSEQVLTWSKENGAETIEPTKENYYSEGISLPIAKFPTGNDSDWYCAQNQFSLLSLTYGSKRSELVPGGAKENETHKAGLDMKPLRPIETCVYPPAIKFASVDDQRSWFSGPRGAYLDGVSATFNLTKEQPGRKWVNFTTFDSFATQIPTGSFIHYGKSPEASKVVCTFFFIYEANDASVPDDNYLFLYKEYELTQEQLESSDQANPLTPGQITIPEGFLKVSDCCKIDDIKWVRLP